MFFKLWNLINFEENSIINENVCQDFLQIKLWHFINFEEKSTLNENVDENFMSRFPPNYTLSLNQNFHPFFILGVKGT